MNNYISKLNDTKENEENYFDLIDFSINVLKEEISNKNFKSKKVFIFLSNEKNDKNYENKFNKYVKSQLSQEFNDVIFLNNILNNDIYFYDESVHFNIRGHNVVADSILKVIKKEINYK